MDLEAQALLQGALDTGSFLRIGGTEPVDVEVRIIAATQRQLEDEVKAETFRKICFTISTWFRCKFRRLRNTEKDVPELLNYYLNYFVEHEKLPYRHFNMAAQNYLRNHDWPGNIMELKNLVQRLLILGAGDDFSGRGKGCSGSDGNTQRCEPWYSALVRSALRQARNNSKSLSGFQLAKYGGNVSQAAARGRDGANAPVPKLRSLGIENKDRK